jgi:hypothetical protein
MYSGQRNHISWSEYQTFMLCIVVTTVYWNNSQAEDRKLFSQRCYSEPAGIKYFF